MSTRRLYDKVMAIFSSLMVFFYLGLAYVILFTDLVRADQTIKVIFSIPLLLYGFYRILLSYQKIRENFFEPDDD